MRVLRKETPGWLGALATGFIVAGGVAGAAVEEGVIVAIDAGAAGESAWMLEVGRTAVRAGLEPQKDWDDVRFADRAVEDFLRAEAVPGPRYAPETGRKVVERDFSGKDLPLFYLFLTRSGTARMWPRFAEMTADDQGIYAEAVASCTRTGGMADLKALLAAAPQAKSDEVRETIRRSLNSMVFFLLDAPELMTADLAAAIGQEMWEKGDADELLVEKLQRREAGEEQGEEDRRVDAFLMAPSTSAMLGRISWISRAAESRKSQCAGALAELHDPRAYARMWALLPGLSADDQVLFCEEIGEPVALEQALPMVRAALAQPVEEARQRMLGAASALVKRALEDPEWQARALEIAARMKAEGTARDFLLEKLGGK
ncbi:MAG: hypothetical protein JWO82_4381 [Akkermansiaceae bacterium]|nr:hypothetical protein [Akkermansiaceae bacterium]